MSSFSNLGGMSIHVNDLVLKDIEKLMNLESRKEIIDTFRDQLGLFQPVLTSKHLYDISQAMLKKDLNRNSSVGIVTLS